MLLEVLTGRRALEEDQALGQRYLVRGRVDTLCLDHQSHVLFSMLCVDVQKDLVEEIRESPSGSPEESWRKQLDHRLLAGKKVFVLLLMSVTWSRSTAVLLLCLQGAPLSLLGGWRWWRWPADVWQTTGRRDQPWQRSGTLLC